MSKFGNTQAILNRFNTASKFGSSQTILEKINSSNLLASKIDTIIPNHEIFKSSRLVNDISDSLATLSSPEILDLAFDVINEDEFIFSTEEINKYELDELEISQNLKKLSRTYSKEIFFEYFSKIPKLIQYSLIFITLQIILPQLNNISSNLISPYVFEYIDSNVKTEKDIVKVIKRADLGIPNFAKSDLRFISGSNVRLREKPSTSSNILDELDLGQVVFVVSKKRNWIEVMYKYENNEVLRGWVFTRYTARFKI